MADVLAFLQREVAVDLGPDDIDAILECARSLPGKWGAKIIRLMHSEGSRKCNWGYLFPRESVNETTPTISITRTNISYTVISWDLLEFATEGSFAEYCGQTIDDAVASVRQIVSLLAGAQVCNVLALGSLGNTP
jgi:hypothetical protein